MKFWRKVEKIVEKAFDIGYAISDKISEGFDNMARDKKKINQARKLTNWVNSWVDDELARPDVEGLQWTSKGNISSKTSQEALDALEASMGGTAKQLKKNNPEEYKARRTEFVMLDRKRATDDAFNEFKSWYEGSKKPIKIKAKDDVTLRSIMNVMGTAYRNNFSDTREILIRGLEEINENYDEF